MSPCLLRLQEHGETLFIMHLAVAPGDRNAGHGSRLLAAVLRHTKAARLAACAEVGSVRCCDVR